MTLTDALSFRKKVELEAQNQATEEKLKEAKDELLKLYKKKDQTEKILKNIQNEIDDYLMQLDDK